MQANIRAVLLSATAAFAITTTPAHGQHHGGGGRGPDGHHNGGGRPDGGHRDNGGGNWGRGNDNRGWQDRGHDHDHDRGRHDNNRYYFGYAYPQPYYGYTYGSGYYDPCVPRMDVSAYQFMLQCPIPVRPGQDCFAGTDENAVSYVRRCSF